MCELVRRHHDINFMLPNRDLRLFELMQWDLVMHDST